MIGWSVETDPDFTGKRTRVACINQNLFDCDLSGAAATVLAMSLQTWRQTYYCACQVKASQLRPRSFVLFQI